MDIAFRTSGTAKLEGSDDDYNKIVAGLRRGLTYAQACNSLPIPIVASFLEQIRPTMEKWAKEGRPQPPGLMPPPAPKPIDHIVKDGRILAIYADGTAREVKEIVSKAK